MNKISHVAVALALLATLNSAHEGWVVKAERDSMTDKTQMSAVTVNALGHALSIYRRDDGSAWANFRLAARSPDILAPGRAPIYRVDKSEPEDLAGVQSLQARGLISDQFAWEPKWVNWKLWHGNGGVGPASPLGQLMGGRTVVFRYFLVTGGSRETTFSLAGAGPVISRALELKKVAPTPSTPAEEQLRAVADLTGACAVELSTALKCIERVKACAASHPEDAAQVRACAAAAQ